MDHDREFNIPLNCYQIDGLLTLMLRANEYDWGDWYGEFKNLLIEIVINHPESFDKEIHIPFHKDNEAMDIPIKDLPAAGWLGLNYKEKRK